MGFPIELFLDRSNIDEEFICTICQDVMKNPTMSELCEHIFCESCITEWKMSSNTCPLDRVSIDVLRPPHRSYLNTLNRLKVKCKFATLGCKLAINLCDIEEHEKSCGYNNPDRLVTCSENCGASLKFYEIPKHNCVSYLKEKLERCDLESVTKTRELFEQIQLRDAETDKLKSEIIDLKSKIVQFMTFSKEFFGGVDGSGTVAKPLGGGEPIFGSNLRCPISFGGAMQYNNDNIIMTTPSPPVAPFPSTSSSCFSTVNPFEVQFKPLIGSDTSMSKGVPEAVWTRLQCIVGMLEYQSKSIEELRYEYYQRARGSAGSTCTAFRNFNVVPGTSSVGVFASSNPQHVGLGGIPAPSASIGFTNTGTSSAFTPQANQTLSDLAFRQHQLNTYTFPRVPVPIMGQTMFPSQINSSNTGLSSGQQQMNSDNSELQQPNNRGYTGGIASLARSETFGQLQQQQLQNSVDRALAAAEETFKHLTSTLPSPPSDFTISASAPVPQPNTSGSAPTSTFTISNITSPPRQTKRASRHGKNRRPRSRQDHSPSSNNTTSNNSTQMSMENSMSSSPSENNTSLTSQLSVSISSAGGQSAATPSASVSFCVQTSATPTNAAAADNRPSSLAP